jgi:hypothetical protein
MNKPNAYIQQPTTMTARMIMKTRVLTTVNILLEAKI